MAVPARNLYLARDVRELDRLAIEEYGIPGYTLMERAGRAAFYALLRKWPGASRLIVLCGGGNNGGDGYIVAGLAFEHELQAEVLWLADPAGLSGSARQASEWARSRGVPFSPFDKDRALPDPASADTVLVDALLGTGLGGPVRDDYARAIAAINASRLPVLAVDIPSGLDADTGQVLGAAVKADLTVSFIGLKLGLARGEGPRLSGELRYADLGVPAALFGRVAPAATLEHPVSS